MINNLISIKPSLEVIKETSKIRKLIKNLPILSGCVQPERVSRMFTLVYDYEIENENNTVFKCTKTDIDYPGTRLWLLNPFHYGAANKQTAKTGFARLVLAEFSTYLKKDRISEEKMQEVFDRYKDNAMVSVKEIDEILSYEEIATFSWWWA